jgi:ribosomal protein S18 acetylase RimI-like enzyme
VDVTIREAVPDNIEAITAMYRDSARVAAERDPALFRIPDESEVRASIERGIADDAVSILVAVSPTDGACLGYTIFVVDFTQMQTGTFSYARYAYVDDIVVVEEARRRGVGTALLRAVEALARDHGADGMALDTQADNAAALHFYREHMGYRDVLVRLLHRFE